MPSGLEAGEQLPKDSFDLEGHPEGIQEATLKRDSQRYRKRSRLIPQGLRRQALTPSHVQEHPGFKRNKLTLLSMGIAVVLVANVTFLGFLTPPKAPLTAFTIFDLPTNGRVDGDPNNGFINLIFNKTASRFPNGTLDELSYDFSKLTLDKYVSQYATIDITSFCPYSLYTAFLVFNGFAFSFGLATLFLVAVVPVFIRRQHWDAYLARVGALAMSITLIFFAVAFLLAGFITAGVGLPSPASCSSQTSQAELAKAIQAGDVPNSEKSVLKASAYATLAMICLLVIVVICLSLKETSLGPAAPQDLEQATVHSAVQDDVSAKDSI